MGAAQIVYGRLGAYERWSRSPKGSEERKQATAKARATFLARFADAPDPEAAMRAYYVEIAMRRHHPKTRRRAA
jgi:hypothetical protein